MCVFVVLTGEADALCDGCEVRQPCAVLSQTDSQWYRGQLMSVDEENNVFEVLLVDVGRSEETNHQCLRLLQHDLMTSPVSLLRVSTQFNNRNGTATAVRLSVSCRLSVCNMFIAICYITV